MRWTKQFIPKAKAGPNPWAVFGTRSGLSVAEAGQVPNSDLLRRWGQKMPFVKGAVDLRRYQAVSADWAIVSRDGTSDFSKLKQRAATQLLESPNVKGKNSSFSGLLGPVMEDMQCIANGVIMPEFSSGGTVGALNYVDGALVRHALGWQSPADGPRYGLIQGDGRQIIPYRNDQLIVMVLNETTYNPYGFSPVAAIFQQLLAWEDTFMSVYGTQKNRAPAGILNLGGMPEDEMRKLKEQMNEVGTLGWINHPIDQFKFEQIGSIDLEKMGTPWWVDLIIKCVCVVFQVSPISLQWTEGVTRATGREQLKITNDQGIEPLMRMIAEYINREIISTFKESNMQFVWRDLMVQSQTEAAMTIKNLSADRVIPLSINAMLKLAGLNPYSLDDFRGDRGAFALVNEPLIWTKESMMPPSILATLPVFQPYDVQFAQQVAQAQANASGEQVPLPDQTGNDETEDS